MSNVKASDVVVIRKLVQDRGPEAVQGALAKLPNARDRYLAVTATEWLPVATEAEIIQAAADVLFPGEPERLEHLGNQVAAIVFSGIYKVFLRIATPEFIAKRLTAIWKTVYDQGEAAVENFTGRSGELVVSGLTDLTPVQRQYICGYLRGLLGLTQAKNVRVISEGTPAVWRWRLTWD